jgi:CcmD family protein
MQIAKSVLIMALLTLTISNLRAAENGQDFFQAIGKMYVVTAVISIIFIGLSNYLFRLDRKNSQLEKKIKS